MDNILKDIADLGLKYERLTHTSDYFPQLIEVGESLIKSGVMYADDTPVDVMRDVRRRVGCGLSCGTECSQAAMPCV